MAISRAAEGSAWEMNGGTTDGYASSSSWSTGGNGTWPGGGGNLQTTDSENWGGQPIGGGPFGSGPVIIDKTPFSPGLQNDQGIQNIPMMPGAATDIVPVGQFSDEEMEELHSYGLTDSDCWWLNSLDLSQSERAEVLGMLASEFFDKDDVIGEASLSAQYRFCIEPI